MVQPGWKAWKRIKEKFGDDVLLPNGEINREKLGQVIFSNPEKRRLLNSITHPEIYKRMMWLLFKYFIKGRIYIQNFTPEH